MEPSREQAGARWSITQEAFDRFLSSLSDDREQAGLEYERVRGRLVLYFQCRGIASPEDHADETINRVARKLALGEEVRDVTTYVFGVARLLLREATRKQERQLPLPETAAQPDSGPRENEEMEIQLACLRACLERLPPNNREIITQYYQEEKRAKINLRQALAERLGIPLNTLRVRACRIRDALQDCVTACARKGKHFL
jgi:RNA polymerase sigma factor (sigma-70 family)